MTQLAMFEPDPIQLPPASRAKDPPTAKAAGRAFEVRALSELHQTVLAALEGGPMTDEDLERLAQFASLAPSTVRKRRSELLHMEPPRIRHVGTVTNRRGKPMMAWGLMP